MHEENLRHHYALTLRDWCRNLVEHWDEAVEEVGLPTAKVWGLYMAGSRLGFETNVVQLHQVLAVKLDDDGNDGGLPLRPWWTPSYGRLYVDGERPTHCRWLVAGRRTVVAVMAMNNLQPSVAEPISHRSRRLPGTVDYAGVTSSPSTTWMKRSTLPLACHRRHRLRRCSMRR